MEKILVKNETKEILSLCKKDVEKKDKLKFVELGRDMFKDNTYILNKYFKNEEGKPCYYANLLAYKDVKNIMSLKELKSELKKDFGEDISLAGYKYNPEHYRFSSYFRQEDYEEELFRDNSDRAEDIKEYINQDRFNKRVPLDYEAIDSLMKVFFKALKKRWIMIFHLESIPMIINNAIECNALGVSNIPSNNIMQAKIAEIKEMLENNEVIEWLKTNPTDMSFDKNDYVETYQKVLRNLTGIKDKPLEYCRDMLENPEDLWIEDIIANDIPDEEPLYERDSDEDEYLENNELFD